MATAMSAALVELSEEKSGVGSAVLQAVNKTGAPFGIAVLGSVLSTGYLGRLHLSGLSVSAAAAVRHSGATGALFARTVRAAFMSGLEVSFVVGAVVASGGVVTVLVWLPSRALPLEAWQPE